MWKPEMARFDHLAEQFATPQMRAREANAGRAPGGEAIYEHMSGARGSWPNVWRFTVDGKLVTAIDHECMAPADFLRYLRNKFGPGRVTLLRPAST